MMLDFLNDICLCKNMVGSRYTVDPPPTDTDEDWLCLFTKPNVSLAASRLESNGFHLENPNEHYQASESTFNSFRGPNNLNVLITADSVFHNRFLAATSLAKRYNLKDRTERVILFQTVLYGSIYDPFQFVEKPKDWY